MLSSLDFNGIIYTYYECRNMPGPIVTKRKRSEHYVNNKEFLAALIEYRNNVEQTFIAKYGREIPQRKTGLRGGILNLPFPDTLENVF